MRARELFVGVMVGVVFLTIAGAMESIQAGEEKLWEFTGVVSVEKTDAGAVKAITITQKAAKEGDKDVVYNVVLDEKGKALAEMSGKTVAGAGVLAVKEGASWITVKYAREKVAEKKG